MKKLIQICVVVAFVGLICGRVSGQTAEVKKNVKRLKITNSCVKCILVGADLTKANLSGAKLQGANLTGATMKNIKNLKSAIQCKTIMPWGEENSGC